jgi:putative peptide zinc metalloprotease protein
MTPDSPLPVLRPDIEVHRGPAASDGSPTYTVHDPLTRTFDKIGWAEAEVFARLRRPTTMDRLLAELERDTALRVTARDVADFCLEAVKKGLTTQTLTRPPEELMAEYQRAKIHPLQWLLHHYLYFRVPLIRPDAFLTRALPKARLLASRPALVIYVLIALAGLTMCLERLDEYFSTFNYFFNFKGLLAFGLCVAAIKAVHEFSHAFTAKSLGLRVPVMGLAFIVMWPVAYCDVTDAWKIADRKKRLTITAAGMAAELAIAGMALTGWALTGASIPHGIFFVISSSSILSTILVNINPAMRFDGYFLLMDLSGIDNLQPRAFALTRWFTRKWLLGVDAPSPDPDIRGRALALVLAYTAYTWLYRLGLYLAIAVLVYHKFTKVLGIFLFCVEIGWFLVAPLWREAGVWFHLHRTAGPNRRNMLLATVLGLAFLWAALPLPRHISVPAVLVAAKNQIVYAPFPGELKGIAAGRGSFVTKGTVISRIHSDKLDQDIAVLDLEKRSLEKRREMYRLDERDKAYLPQQDEEIANAQAKLASLLGQREQSRQIAEIDGTMYAWDESLRDGLPVAHQQILGRLADLGDFKLHAFVQENLVGDVGLGGRAVFFSDAGGETAVGTIKAVNPVRAETMDYLALTSQAKGVFPVIKEPRGKLLMLESYYTLEIALAKQPVDARIGQTGVVWLTTRPRSLLADAGRRLYRILVRELSF